jgi:opacity protein-like surface antigen
MAAMLAGVFVAGGAHAADGRYLSFTGGSLGKTDFSYGGGSVTATTAYKAGSQFGAAYGQKMGTTGNWRGELSVWSGTQDIDKAVYKSGSTTLTNTSTGDIKLLSLTANAYYDFTVKGPVVPYVGFGVGVTKVDIDDGFSLKDSTTGVSAQLMAGVSVKVSKQCALYAEARYQRQGRFDIQTTSGGTTTDNDVALDNTALLAGLRVNF